MTHSTRRSYKEKYELLKKKAGPDHTEELVQNLAEFSEFQALSEQRRAQQYDLLQELAKEITDLVIVMDAREGQLRMEFKDIRKPLDANLCSMDGDLIIRRARDVVRYASERIGIAGCRIADLDAKVSNLTVGASLLKPAAIKSKHGFYESYVVGSSPTEEEKFNLDIREGRNPRLIHYDYETDQDNSDLEEDDREEINDTALVSTRDTRFAKPQGRTASSRRLSQEKAKNNSVDFS
jgi:hypothetical protein